MEEKTMKFLERLSLNLFSAVVLLLSAIIVMMVGSFLKPDFLTNANFTCKSTCM